MTKRIISFILILFIKFSLFSQSDDSKLANEYYQEGQYDKAETLFQKLSKRKKEMPLIHANYLDLLIQKSAFKEAEKFTKSVLKNYPDNIQYKTSLVRLYELSNQQEKKDEYFNILDKELGKDYYKLSLLAQDLANQNLRDDAIEYYKKSRAISNNKSSFALDLATIYRLNQDIENMTLEYLNYANSNPRNISYVKNIFQNLLKEEDQEYLEKTLIKNIQKNPEQSLYVDLLIWLELQRKNFYGAFVQSRALDKRLQKPGDQSMRIARIASDNNAWDDAIEIFQYVMDEYPDGRNSMTAKRLYIESREQKVKETFPIDFTEIRILSKEYYLLYKQVGVNPTTLQALRNKALLHAFYLDEKDSAVIILNNIIENRRAPRSLTSKCKLDLGDIYLLINQPWESTLLYSQVEKLNKDAPLGYEAKLRNAKLNYYTGNFSLAKEHLDILKLATTREISNDAISLGILIQDNTVFDTTDFVMQEFAGTELLIYQNKNEEAEDQLLRMLIKYPGHSLTDEIYWILAKLNQQKRDFVSAIQYLDKIIESYNYDILSDDAYYKKGVIQTENLNDDLAALDTFVEFLKAHPGSIYAAEARTRIRKLRGDYIN